MLAVDPVTGAMYALPDTVTGAMADPAPATDAPNPPTTEPAKTSGTAPKLIIVSTESLSLQQLAVSLRFALRDEAVRYLAVDDAVFQGRDEKRPHLLMKILNPPARTPDTAPPAAAPCAAHG